MKTKKILSTILSRAFTVLVFGAVSALVILCAAGIIDIPLIDLPDITEETAAGTVSDAPETSPPVPSTSPDTTGTPVSSTESLSGDTSAVAGTDTTVLSSADETTATAPDLKKLSDYTAEGYKITWSDWTSSMALVQVFQDGYLPTAEKLGGIRQEYVRYPYTYEEGGIEFLYYRAQNFDRRAVELYMGYVIIDSGKGDATSILPNYKTVKERDGTEYEVRTGRSTVKNTDTVTIYSSEGIFIGTYPSNQVNFAYTRDTSDRALFTYNSNYYYIDPLTGDFLISDYNDETDNRGLYYDYTPGFGKSDCSIQKFSTYQSVTLTYTIDTYPVYSRREIDWRIARVLYELYPDYADKVGGIYGNNKPFADALNKAKKALAAENRTKNVTAAPETASPAPAQTSQALSTSLPEVITSPEATQSPVTEPSRMAEQAQPTLPEDTGTDTGTPSESSADITGESTQNAETPSESDAETSAEPETTESTIITVPYTFDAYRFSYGKTAPAVDLEYITTMRVSDYSTYVSQESSWATSYKYAKAYNFSEGRAVTADDNGFIRIINTYGSTAVYLHRTYLPTYHTGSYVTEYYIEPFYRDVSMTGYYYYDNGLMRIRRVSTPSSATTYYINDEDLLIDKSGNIFEIPAGYTLCSYADGILVLENDGRYGCYSKDGYWIAQPEYTSASPFLEGLCVLGKADGTYGMIDTSGKTVLPFIYSYISNPSTGLIAAYSSTGWQVFAKMTK